MGTNGEDAGHPLTTEREDFPTRWYYAQHEDAEHWYGAKDTRDEAIEAGRLNYDGQPFWLCAGHAMAHNLDVFDDDVDGVISAFQRQNEELFGEDGQGDPETDWTDAQCRQLATRLNATFAAWAREQGFHRAYMIDFTSSEAIAEQVPA